MSITEDWVSTPLEEVLGPAQGRFFGGGYRDVRHRVGTIRPTGADTVELSAHVSYPPGWSLDDTGRSREPHLSTIDAVVVPLLALGHLGESVTSRVSRVDLRAGSRPWTDLEDVPAQLVRERSVHEQDGEKRCFRATVGNIRAFLEIAAADQRNDRYSVGTFPGIYSGLYRLTRSKTELADYDPETGCLRALHHFEVQDGAPARALSGIEADYWPCVCVIDYLVVMGQLAQALIELRHGVGRAGGLWMRRMSISLGNVPASLPMRLESSMSLTRDKLIDRNGRRYRDIAVESCTSTGVRVSALLAQEETR